MTNHEMIKRLPLEELAKLLTTYGVISYVGDDWCKNYCEHRLPNHGCYIDDCVYQDEAAVKAWLKEQSTVQQTEQKEMLDIEGLTRTIKALGLSEQEATAWLKDEDRIMGVDFTQGKDVTVITCDIRIDEFKKLNKLAEIGKATIKALEYQPKSEEEEIVFNSIEELTEWAKANEVVKTLREIKENR